MPWTCEFVPDDCNGISVILEGGFWNRHAGAPTGYIVTWNKSEGTQVVTLPEPLTEVTRFQVSASAQPYKTHAVMIFRYNGVEKERMEFDKEENHEIKR